MQRTAASEVSPARRARSVQYLERRLGLLETHMRSIAEIGLDGDIAGLVDAYCTAASQARAEACSDDDESDRATLEYLRTSFGLSDFEENVLLLSCAPLVSPVFSELVVEIARNFSRTTPDVGLAIQLFTRTFDQRLRHREAFAANSSLIRDHIVELDTRTALDDNLLTCTLRPSKRIQALLLESGANDPTLEGFSRIVWPQVTLDDVVLPDRRLDQVLQLVDNYELFVDKRRAWGAHRISDAGGDGLTLLFGGNPGTGKTRLAHALAHRLGRPLLTVDAHQLTDRRRLGDDLDAILREARLQRALLFFDECEALFASRLQGNANLVPLLTMLDAWDGIAILATNLPGMLDAALDRRITLQVDFDVPGPRLRERIWRLHIPPGTPLSEDVDLPFLAEKYEFAGGHIRNSVVIAINRALGREPGTPVVTMRDLDNAARSQVRHKLKSLADHNMETSLTLDDVILPRDVKAQLVAVVAAVRNRRMIFEEWGFGQKLTKGKGLCSLFRGDSGTGKTLAAEIISNELAMPLYRVRIPAIVDKYVGETEKNLEKCFREASQAGALLLFDEADSIFSKRVEVSSSNDRHSNMEVNLLLQEIERFDGVVILTTNLDAAIDDAFDRRLNFKIDFPFPNSKARARIWRHLIPDQAPVDGEINYRFLGKDYELSGGSIKNAVIRAAYNAAERRVGLTMDLLEEAAVQEYRELGKLVPMHRNPWD